MIVAAIAKIHSIIDYKKMSPFSNIVEYLLRSTNFVMKIYGAYISQIVSELV